MKVLVFNCGSSSLKYKMLEMPAGVQLCGGEAQRIGAKTAEGSRLVHRQDGESRTIEVEMKDHAGAFREVMRRLQADPTLAPDVVAHRMVHGGGVFDAAAAVTPETLAELERIQNLAPIHNPPATALVRAVSEQMPSLPQTVVFDTAFHATLPPRASIYALPRTLREDRGYRKYGFHGTSHRFVAGEAARLLGKPFTELNAVSCHLGSGGASLCAIRNGRSIDTTMGYSPLQGLMMSTRCGDLDPAVVMNLVADRLGDSAAVEALLNKKSGVLGMSGLSADIRDVLRQADAADPDGAPDDTLRLTAGLYAWRIRKYLGAYLAVLGNADAVIFTDTIGEEVPAVRRAVAGGMEVFGVRLDAARNADPGSLPADIAAPESAVRVLVIATNEEIAIARETYQLMAA